jgi:hypothetical protein
VIVLGLVLLLVGWLLPLALLFKIGVALLVIGAVFAVLGVAGHPVGGRSWF